MKRVLSSSDIKRIAMQGLSRYNGNGSGIQLPNDKLTRYDGGERYPSAFEGKGYPSAFNGQPMYLGGSPLEFEGKTGQAQPGTMDRRKYFRFRIVPAVDDAIYLTPGIVFGTQGMINDGAFVMIGGGAATGTCLSTGTMTKTIKQYMTWAQNHPHEIIGFKLTCTNNSAQLDASMTAIYLTPFDGDPESVPYHPSMASDQYVLNQTQRVFNTPGLNSSDEVLLKYPVTKDAIIDFTLIAGTAWNPAKLIKEMAQSNPMSLKTT